MIVKYERAKYSEHYQIDYKQDDYSDISARITCSNCGEHIVLEGGEAKKCECGRGWFLAYTFWYSDPPKQKDDEPPEEDSPFYEYPIET